MKERFLKIGFMPGNIMVPKNVDMKKWSVVACDQYTSQPSYWKEVEKYVNSSQSAYHLMLPEIYLDKKNTNERIEKINEAMEQYIESDIFKTYAGSFIYVERKQNNGKVRKGLIGIIDLEKYDYNENSNALCRATEKTVLERIPPRVKVRENAKLEMPHIMLLVDDIEKTVIDPLEKRKKEFSKIYDFDLMQDSGHIKGYVIKDEKNFEKILSALENLADEKKNNEKYGADGKSPLLFVVGDGNHSLATAKACYEAIKEFIPERKRLTHPARYALLELVNLHDESLEFEPIHRVIFDVNPEHLLEKLFEYYPDAIMGENEGQVVKYVTKEKEKYITFEHPTAKLPVGTLQKFLDDYLQKYGGKIDYIHGDDVVRELSQKDNTIGFILPPMDKKDLFKTVIFDGVLPRKTFSMGEAQDKRFYLECRKIK